MKLVTPAIAWHNRERVSSVDFQPVPWPSEDGSQVRMRLASCGDDHHVVIWGLTAEENIDERGGMTPLCDLSRHQNSVNVVRWSPDGRILASGDTDSAIFLWQFDPNSTVPNLFGEDSNGEEGCPPQKENWTILRILRGHLQDVIGLSFSPCGSQLCSCSTDGTAIVFDVAKGNKLKILSDHKGWVNGVAWDPLGEAAVVTIASDRVLRVFKPKSFKLRSKTFKCLLPLGSKKEEEKSSSSSALSTVRLFHDDTFPSFFRRAAFSPDGEVLAVPSGVLDVEGQADQPTHCTYIFSRMNFAKPVLYLPHRECSVAVRFSPIRYRLRNLPRPTNVAKEGGEAGDKKEEEKQPWENTQTLFCLPYRMVYAVATVNSVTIYDTQQAEPFARISKIHYIGLTDLSWSADGSVLVISSTDGFCSLVTFKEGEIGEKFREEEDKENAEKDAQHAAGASSSSSPERKEKAEEEEEEEEDGNQEREQLPMEEGKGDEKRV